MKRLLIALVAFVGCSGCVTFEPSTRISTSPIVEEADAYTYWNCANPRPTVWIRSDILVSAPYTRSVVAHEMAHVRMALAHPLGCEGHVAALRATYYRFQAEAYAFCAQSQWAAHMEGAFEGDLVQTMRHYATALSRYGFPGVTESVAFAEIKRFCDAETIYPPRAS